MTTAPAAPAPTLIMRSLNPLLFISFALMCLGGVVLLLHGHMALVWPAFMLLVMGQLAFPFILLPAGMMAGLWHALRASRAKMLVRFFAVASVGYIAAVMAATAWLQAFLMDKLPAGAPPFFVEMYVIAGALTPWAVFALRDRRNQLFIIMLWAMLAGCLLMLPLRLSGAAGGLGYALGIWAVMLAVLFVENLRETRRAARIAQAEERAKAAEEAPPSDDKAPEA